MKSFLVWLEGIIHRPQKVFLICLAFVMVSLIAEGSLWRLYRLQKDQIKLNSKIQEEKSKIVKIHQDLKRAKDPSYIEHQAREKFELLEKDDLLFIFSED